MKLKRISAGSIAEALTIARRELGDEAVLLETKKAPQGKGVVVTFAMEVADEPLFADDPISDAWEAEVRSLHTPSWRVEATRREAKPTNPAKEKISAGLLRSARNDAPPISQTFRNDNTFRPESPALEIIHETFAYHTVPEALAGRLLAHIHKQRLMRGPALEVAATALADAFTELLPFQPLTTQSLPKQALMLIGPHGAGKSSTLAKLASSLAVAGAPVVLVSTDMERLGAADALREVARILKCDFYPCEKRQQLKLLTQQYLGKAWVLVDSAGANIYDFQHMKALGEFASLASVEPILTCPAGMDASEAEEMARVFDFLPITRMMVTRLDAARRLKGVFAALTTGGYALANATASPSPAEPCTPLTPATLARTMLRDHAQRMGG